MQGRFEGDPAGGEHPQEVTAREKQDVAFNGAHAAQYTICPCAYLGWRFATRAAIPEQLPVRPPGADLCRTETLIFAVVPLDQVAVDFGHGPESSQSASPGGALERAGKHLREYQSSEPIGQCSSVTFALRSKRQIRKAGVLTRYRPCRFSMPGEVSDRKWVIHSCRLGPSLLLADSVVPDPGAGPVSEIRWCGGPNRADWDGLCFSHYNRGATRRLRV